MNNAASMVDGLWQPFAYFGITHPFFVIDVHLVLYTWVVLGLLLLAALAVRLVINNRLSLVRCAAVMMTEALVSMSQQGLGSAFQFGHFVFVSSIFIFIFLCNTASLIPWVEEPTRSIETTLALAIIAFLYKEYFALKTHGLVGYVKTYCEPFAVMIPLAMVGRMTPILSLSCRLVGNISGGAIIMQRYFATAESWALFEVLGLLSGLHFIILIFFGLFESFIQAFVFSMLSLTYLSIAMQHEEEEEDAHEHESAPSAGEVRA